MNEPHVKWVCTNCGSSDVVGEAPVQWNVANQAWELCGDPYDNLYCDNCDQDTYGEAVILDEESEDE